MSAPGSGETPSGVAPNLSEAALQRFETSLPERPWCSNHSHGRYPRVLPKLRARRYLYIQPQPPWLRVWLNFDYDRKDAWCAADEVGLPAPTLAVINPENGHGHLAYGLAVPVLLGPENSGRPKRYLAAIERAMAVRLGADLSYRGPTCKNPFHPCWETLSSDHLFMLSELHAWLADLNDYRLPKGQVIGVGRNVETFDATRRWAYRAVPEHRGDGGTLDTWLYDCIGHAEAFTVARHVPALDRSECRWIGRSVGRWTWERVTDEWFSEQQARRGRASGASRRAAAAERDRRILELADSGMTWAEIRAVTGVSRSTVARALQGAGGQGKGGCHEPDQDVSALGGSRLAGWGLRFGEPSDA